MRPTSSSRPGSDLARELLERIVAGEVEPFEKLGHQTCHQGSVGEVAYAAVPHLVAVARTAPDTEPGGRRGRVLHLLRRATTVARVSQPGGAMIDGGVGSWIERWARNAPRRVAVVSGQASWTYEELAARVRRLAQALRSLGVRRGDRVAWLGPNHAAFLETFFATGLLRAVLVPVNHRRDEPSIAHILADSGASVLVARRSMARTTLAPDVRARIVVEGGEAGHDYETLVAQASDELIEERVSLEDLCMLPYTSGTTGASKGVMLTHRNVTWNVVDVLSCTDIRSDDVTIAIAPFFRVGGTGVNVLPVLFKGGTVVIPEGSDPGELLALVERHGVTVGFANPDLLEAMLRAERWPSVDLSRVRFFMTGGAPVPERLIRAYLARGVTLLQGYGLSEAAPLALLLDPASALRKVGAAGRPPLLVDADGDVWIVDRAGDGYVSMGQLVYPGDVERVLLAHPAVADAGVVGVPEGGAAFVVLEPGATASEEALTDHCRAGLPAHAVPRTISFVPSLPRSSVGKLLRNELRGSLES